MSPSPEASIRPRRCRGQLVLSALKSWMRPGLWVTLACALLVTLRGYMPIVLISPPHASMLARGYLPRFDGRWRSVASPTVTEWSLEFVTPNVEDWSGEPKEWTSGKQRFAYVVKIESGPHSCPSSTVWVDAATGALLGGST